jgi:hypothetical protein
MQGYNTGYLKKKERSCKKILGLNGEYYQLLAGKNPSVREYNTTYEMQEKGLHPTWRQIQLFCKASEENSLDTSGIPPFTRWNGTSKKC